MLNFWFPPKWIILLGPPKKYSCSLFPFDKTDWEKKKVTLRWWWWYTVL